MLAIAWVYGIRVSWMGKHTLFRRPFGPVMRSLGGIAVDRRAPHGVVGQMAEIFADREQLILAVPPEGTRKRVEHWKSGFYEIARAADVPIAAGFLDYRRRRGGIGPLIRPTGDVAADMDDIREFYADKTGRHPERFAVPRLRAEDTSH